MTLSFVLRGHKEPLSPGVMENAVSHAEHAAQRHEKTCHGWRRITVHLLLNDLRHKFPDIQGYLHPIRCE